MISQSMVFSVCSLCAHSTVQSYNNPARESHTYAVLNIFVANFYLEYISKGPTIVMKTSIIITTDMTIITVH